MGRAAPSQQPKESRVRRVSEVSLGFNKKIAQDEARRCPQCATATCLPACPLGIDIPGFIRLLREGDTSGALEKIRQQNPYPAICGRVCPAPCERSCVFQADGNPIAIRSLERFAADHGSKKGTAPKIVSPQAKKVAVIGSGPAGMTAADYLAQSGLGVTIFEAAHRPGGLLRYGIPEFRLPQRILDEQFAQLKLMGVDIQTDMVLGRTLMIDEIFMRGFSAVLLAMGKSLPRFSELSGSGLAGVYYDTEFLHLLQAVDKEGALDLGRRQKMATPKTVVVGRGPSAFDAGRLALRLGSEVQVVFDGFEEEAAIDMDMLQEAKEEGIGMQSMQALGIVGENGFAAGVQCRKLDIVESQNGLSLQASNEEPVVLEAQTVVLANGHTSNDTLKQYLPHLKWEADGSLSTNAQTGMTSVEKIFGCGSITGAADTLVDSMVSGRTAAEKITKYLIS